MAVVAKSGTPSLSTFLPSAPQKVSGLLTGEAIAAGDACYVNAAGRIMRSNGTAAGAAAAVVGFAAEAAASGEAVTLFHDVDLNYGTALVPGTKLYVFTTAGQIGDAATVGGTAPIGYVVDATRIHVWESRY